MDRPDRSVVAAILTLIFLGWVTIISTAVAVAVGIACGVRVYDMIQ